MRFPRYWIKALLKRPGLVRWYFHWLSSLDGLHSPLKDELPWVTYEAIEWLNQNLNKDMLLFEWGSGGSTVFFSKRVSRVVTIEHDAVWFQEVTNTLKALECTNLSLNLITPSPSAPEDDWYRSTDPQYSDYSFESYVKSIDVFPDLYFDIVVVDGRARPGCMYHALSKIKVGGYLILDNSDRTEYSSGTNLMAAWNPRHKFGPGPYIYYPTCTTIWQRPS